MLSLCLKSSAPMNHSTRLNLAGATTDNTKPNSICEPHNDVSLSHQFTT